MNELADAYWYKGQLGEAEPLYIEPMRRRRVVLGPDHAGLSHFFLATIATKRRVLCESHPDTVWSLQRLGGMYVRQGRYDEAEAILLKTYESFVNGLGRQHERTKDTITSFVALYEAWKKPEKAAEWRAKLPR